MNHVRNILTDPQPEDAMKLAQFWDDSEAAWPGAGEGQHSVEEAGRCIREKSRLGMFMAEADGRFVALCEFDAKHGQKLSAYVPELVAIREYQGKGHGKAVLLAAVEAAFDLGYDRIDLDTWEGNARAITLYKKCGFMWIPDTSVDMMNFTLTARRHPAFREYFSRHDWYATQVRDLSITEDQHRRGDVRVFPYEWRADNGDLVRMVVDRHSGLPLEIENRDFRISCHLEAEDLIAGLPHKIRWEIENHGDAPLNIRLETKADAGIDIDFGRTLTVRGSKTLTASFRVDPDAPEKKKEPRAHIVTTKCSVNGIPITLGAGFKLKQPVEMFMDPRWPVYKPGRARDVSVYLRSKLDVECDVTPELNVEGKGCASLVTKRVRLQAKEVKCVPVKLRAEDNGLIMLNGRCRVKLEKRRAVRTKVAELPLLIRNTSACTGGVNRYAAVVAGPATKVSIDRRSARISFTDVVHCHGAGHVSAPSVGPPFPHDRRFADLADARIEHTGLGVCAILCGDHATLKGIRLERRVYLDQSPLVRIEDVVINNSDKCVSYELSRDLYGGGSRSFIPTPAGVMRAAHGDGQRHPYHLKMSKSPEDWRETWTAVEHEDGGVIGLFWRGASRVEHYGNGLSFRCRLPKIDPGGRAKAPPLFHYAGPGDATTIRSLWQSMHGRSLPEKEVRKIETVGPLTIGLRPAPLFIQGDAKTKVVIEHPGERTLSGTWKLELPRSLKGSLRSGAFKRVCKSRRLSKSLVVSAGTARRPRVETAVLAMNEGQREIRHETSLIVAAANRPVLIEKCDDGIIRCGNRILTVDVGTAFGGAVTDIRSDGISHVLSAYPNARPLRWWNPWYGGIQPAHHSINGSSLANETFHPREVRRRGTQGIVWQGVRLQLTPKHKRAHGQRMAIEYLMTDGQPILVVVLERRHLLDCPTGFGVGFDAFLQPGGPKGKLVLSGALDPEVRLHSGDEDIGLSCRNWGLAENPRTGHSLIAVKTSASTHLNMDASAELGCHISAGWHGRLQPGETERQVFFFVFGTSADAVRPYACLQELKELP